VPDHGYYYLTRFSLQRKPGVYLTTEYSSPKVRAASLVGGLRLHRVHRPVDRTRALLAGFAGRRIIRFGNLQPHGPTTLVLVFGEGVSGGFLMHCWWVSVELGKGRFRFTVDDCDEDEMLQMLTA
jgi:hypothetical protein